MHDTTYEIGGLFLRLCGRAGQTILDLGSYNVNGTLKDFQPRDSLYAGADLMSGPGVDIVVSPSMTLPFAAESFDIVLSTSAFEHDPAFWETFLEMARVLKANGFIYLNVPSNGWYHCYPLDCWRLYPDAGKALEAYARRRGFALSLVESFVADRKGDRWNDFVAIFVKSERADCSKFKFLSDMVPCTNVRRIGESQLRSMRIATEDMVIIEKLQTQSSSVLATFGADLAATINNLDQLAQRTLSLQRRFRAQVLRTTGSRQTEIDGEFADRFVSEQQIKYALLFSTQQSAPKASGTTRLKYADGCLIISDLDNDPRIVIDIPPPGPRWLIARIEIILEMEAILQIFTKTVSEPRFIARHAISRRCAPGRSDLTLILARDEPIEAVRIDPMDRTGTAAIPLLELHAPVLSTERGERMKEQPTTRHE